MKVLKINNGKVEIYDEEGKCEKTIERNATDAIFNPDQTYILLSLKNGDLEVMDRKGNHISTFHVDDVVDLKWDDRDVLARVKGDKTEVYDMYGKHIRTISHQRTTNQR